MRTGFEGLRVYQLAEEVADLAWNAVSSWDYIAKQAIGRQFINSAYIIGANFAEGTGRGNFADNRRFP